MGDKGEQGDSSVYMYVDVAVCTQTVHGHVHVHVVDAEYSEVGSHISW